MRLFNYVMLPLLTFLYALPLRPRTSLDLSLRTQLEYTYSSRYKCLTNALYR